MHISKDIYSQPGSSLFTKLHEVVKRVYINDFEDYSSNTRSKPYRKAVIGIGVGLGVGAFLFICGPALLCILCTKYHNRKQKKKKRKEERERMERLLVTTSDHGVISEGNDGSALNGANSDLFDSCESRVPSEIVKPSNAVLYTKMNLVPQQRNSYEYEPLPPYEIIQSNAPKE